MVHAVPCCVVHAVPYCVVHALPYCVVHSIYCIAGNFSWCENLELAEFEQFARNFSRENCVP